MHLHLMAVFFTAWGYELTYLELIAFITSLIGVGLGIFGPRVTWPWWSVGSILYAIWFYEYKYFASAALQFVFIAASVWGWFGWGPKGAKPKKFSPQDRAIWAAILVTGTLLLNPLLKHIGAASTNIEAFGFVGSCIAQVWMVIERYESWILWLIVDAAYTYQYWNGGYYLSAILYFIFTLMAIAGWKRWLRESHII